MLSSLSRSQRSFLLLIGSLIVVWALGWFVFQLHSPFWLIVPAVMIYGAYRHFLIPTGIEMVRSAPQDLRMVREGFVNPTVPRWRKVAAVAIVIAGIGAIYVFLFLDPFGLRPFELFGFQ